MNGVEKTEYEHVMALKGKPRDTYKNGGYKKQDSDFWGENKKPRPPNRCENKKRGPQNYFCWKR